MPSREGRLLFIGVVGVPQELGEHVQAGDAVGEAVVDADDERGAPVLERAGDPYAPEWSGVVEALGHDCSHQPLELGALPHRLRGRADVIADIELRVVDPGRRGKPQRGRRQALPGAGQIPKPRLDAPAHPLDRQRLSVAGGLDDRQLQGVAGDRLGFEPQDARVAGAQSLQAAQVCPMAPACRVAADPRGAGTASPPRRRPPPSRAATGLAWERTEGKQRRPPGSPRSCTEGSSTDGRAPTVMTFCVLYTHKVTRVQAPLPYLPRNALRSPNALPGRPSSR